MVVAFAVVEFTSFYSMQLPLIGFDGGLIFTIVHLSFIYLIFALTSDVTVT